MTTILAVRRGNQVAVVGDGQVTFGDVVMKHSAHKIRFLYEDRVAAGFAGAVADALTLLERFESQLEQYHGNLRRAAVELGKEWRSDKALRRLEAQLVVADSQYILVLSGDGDIIEPDEGVVAIGTGGPYAQAAALALLNHTEMGAEEIARTAMQIAARMDLYTNNTLTVNVINADGTSASASDGDAPADLPLPEAKVAADNDDDDDDDDDEEDKNDDERKD